MDRIKVDNFLGLYTNVDESKLNPEYQSEAVNVRFRTGYVESEGYVSLEANLPANVIYEAPVVLDDDRLHNKFNEFGELVNDYKQNLQEYLMVVSSAGNRSKIDFELLRSVTPVNIIPESPNSPLEGEPLPPDFYSPGSSLLPVLFYWERIRTGPFARWYRIQISTISGNNFESGIIFEQFDIPPHAYNSNAGSVLIADPLVAGNDYYWRISGRTSEGNWGEYGAIQTIWVSEGSSSLEPPILISPLNNSSDINLPMRFEWSQVLGNKGYHIQIATDIEFNSIIIGFSTPIDWTSYSNVDISNGLNYSTKYYWRMLTLGVGGGGSQWSEIRSFTTQKEPASEPTTYEFTKVYKHWNSNGVVLLLTDNGIYWVGKIDRTHLYSGYSVPPIVPGIFIIKYIPFDFQINLILSTIESISSDIRTRITLEIVSVETIIEELGGGTAKSVHHTVNAYYPDRYVRGTYKLSEIYRKIGEEWVYTETIYPTEFSTDILRVDGDDWYNHRNEKVLSWINVPVESKIVFDDADRFSGTEMEVVATYTFDEKNEYVYGYKKISSTSSSYFLKASNLLDTLPLDIQKDPRISGISLYAKTNSSDDFQQLMFIPLLAGKPVPYSNDFYFTERHYNGFFLSQTIGVVYSPSTYKPISDFTDYLEIDGIAYGIFNQRVYFPAIGKGQILNGTFYDYIPEVEGDLLSDVNGTLGVFGARLKLVVAQDSRDGYLLFSIKDKMNFKIRDQYDLATSPEGIIIHTKRGIYVTNGYERKLISEQINDIVEKNFDTGNIFYHRTEDILFYSYVDSKGNYHTFKFDFVYGNWSEVKDGISGKLTFSEDGIIHFLNEERGKVYKLDKTNNVYSVIRTPNVDLDYPFLGKNLIYIDVDFEGELNYENYKVTHTKRMTARLGVPVSKRIPNALIGARFIFKGKIYTIDIYYDAIGEFRHENHIPSPETISEGIQQYPDYLESITK